MASSLGMMLTACGGGADESASDAREQPAGLGNAESSALKARGKQKLRARAFARRGVTAIVVARDGSAIGVAHADGRVRVLENSGARDKRLLKSQGGTAIAGLVFSADGRHLVSVGRDSVAEFWNVETGERRFSLHGHEHALRTVAASADGSVIVTGGDETRVMVWDGSTGKLKRILSGHTDFVNALTVSPNGTLVASGDAAARVLVWRIGGGAPLHTLRGHADEVNALAFSADGALLASAGEDGKVLLWNMTSGRQEHALSAQGAPVRSLGFNQDGTLLACGCEDGRVLVWDMSTRSVVRDVVGSSRAVNVVVFDGNNKNRIFVGDELDGVFSLNLAGR